MISSRAIHVLFVTSCASMMMLLSATQPAHAQENPETIILAIPDVFPADMASATTDATVFGALIHEPGEPDMILLHPDLSTPPFLAQAAEALRRSRAAAERTPVLATRARTGLLKTTAHPDSARPLPAMTALLTELRGQPKVEIQGMGTGRLMHVAISRLGF